MGKGRDEYEYQGNDLHVFNMCEANYLDFVEFLDDNDLWL